MSIEEENEIMKENVKNIDCNIEAQLSIILYGSGSLKC